MVSTILVRRSMMRALTEILLVAAEGAGQGCGDGRSRTRILMVAAHHEVPLRGHLDAARGLEVHHHLAAPVQLVDEALFDLLLPSGWCPSGCRIDEGRDRDGGSLGW